MIEHNADAKLPGITFCKPSTIQRALVFMLSKEGFNVPLMGPDDPVPPPHKEDEDSDEEYWWHVEPVHLPVSLSRCSAYKVH